MIQEIVFSNEFQRVFKRLKKRYRSLPDDFKKLLLALVDNPLQGNELHDGMRKVRLNITAKRKGKRGGGRVIIRLTIDETRLAILYIYDKSDMANINDDFLDEIIKKLDESGLNLSSKAMN